VNIPTLLSVQARYEQLAGLPEQYSTPLTGKVLFAFIFEMI
jgi:hypothetical protein